MAYQISYCGKMSKAVCRPNKETRPLYKWLLVSVIAMLLVGALLRKDVRRIFLPGNPDITEKALYDLAADIQEGQPVSDAFMVFCRQILDHA
jgi:hypothetical protein